MSPLDDELRTALASRADDAVLPSDFFSGVERRARRMRRSRVAASVAGSALAVSALGLGAPLVASTLTREPAPPAASSAPTEAVEQPAQYTLDPADPWAYRGDPALAAPGDLDAYAAEWALRHRVPAGDVELVPLFGAVDEPSGTPELVYLVEQRGSSTRWWGVAQATESGAELVVDKQLAGGTVALAAALPGDEVSRLLVVAAPDVGALEYGPDAASEYAAMSTLAPGVAVTPLEGDAGSDSYRVLSRSGDVLVRAPAPDAPAEVRGEPANLLDWPSRGSTDPALVRQAEQSFARAVGAAGRPVASRVLFGGDEDGGTRYVLLQAWVEGDDAHTFGYTVRPDGEVEPFLGPKTDPDTRVLALLVAAGPGSETDTLVVVPMPGTGQVLYGEAASEYRPVGEDQSLDGVVLVDRRPGEEGDRLRLLDGDGDPDAPLFDGPVSNLLCGLRGCG